jgi:hypothetical protein
MSGIEDNFDEFLKQKVQESHFEYDDAYWLKAEKMITPAEPSKKTFWLGFGIGMLSLSLIAGLTALLVMNTNDKTKTLANRDVVNPNPKAAERSKQHTLTSPTTSATLLNSILQPSKNVTPMALSASNHSLKSSGKSGLLNQNIHTNLQSKLIHHQTNQPTVTALAEGLKQENQILSGENISPANTDAQELIATDVLAEEKEISIAAPVVIDARASKSNNKDIDINIATACEHQNKHEWMFNLLAGVSDSRGFEGNTPSDSRIGFGFFAGGRLSYKLDKNWFIGIQPLFYSRGAINTSIETEKTDYAFGVQADEFIVKNKALMFVEMPLSIGYRVTRHQISIGGGFEYLANVKSDVKEFGTSSFTPNQWGYTNGFNRLGTIAVFNYAFNVYKEFWLTMMIQKGFTDLTKANYFTTNSNDKNSNLRIGIQYQFSNSKKKFK